MPSIDKKKNYVATTDTYVTRLLYENLISYNRKMAW